MELLGGCSSVAFFKPAIIEDIEILDLLFNAGRFGLSVIYIGKMIFLKEQFRRIG